MRLQYVAVLAVGVYGGQRASALPIAAISLQTESVARTSADYIHYPAAFKYDHTLAINSQHPSQAVLMIPTSCDNGRQRIQSRQLLPSSGDDFWHGGSGGVQLGNEEESDEEDMQPE